MLDEKDKSTSSMDTSEGQTDVKQDAEEQSSDESMTTTTEESETKTEDSEPAIDYKAEAERYKRLADKKQEALERISKAQAKKQEKNDDEEEENSSSSNVDEIVEKRFDAFRKEQVIDFIDEALESVAESPEERELIETIYNHRMTPTGYTKTKVLEDIKDAKLLANRKKFEDSIRVKSEAEVKKALAEDKHMSSGGGGSYGRRPPESDDNEFTSEERELIDKYKKMSQQFTQK